MASIPSYTPKSGRRANTQKASKSATTKNQDAAPARKWRPIRHTSPIWTLRQPVSGVQSAIQPKSGRHANHQLASNPPYNPNLDATQTIDGRPIRPRSQIWTPPQPVSGVQSAIHPQIWTPRQPPTGVQSAIHLQSGRRADTQQASKSATTKNLDAAPTPKGRPFRPTPPNLDAAPTPKRRPNQQPPRIRTPPQPVSGVQSALELKSGRHANHRLASIPPYISNLDATPATDWRPIRPTPPQSGRRADTHWRPNQQQPRIRTPPQPVSGVQSAIHLKSGRHPNHRLASNPPYISNLDATTIPNRRPIRPRFPIWTPRQPPTGVQSALHLKSGRRANRPLASNPPYNSNLDAAQTTDWRPIRPTPQIWTPRQHPTGVQIIL